MRNERLMKARQRANPSALAFVAKNLAIVDQIFDLMEERGWTQKNLASKLGKAESEVSKILSGMQNITLQTLVNLEVVLGEDIIVTPAAYSKKIRTSVEIVAQKIEEEVSCKFKRDSAFFAYSGHYQYKVDGKNLIAAQVEKLVGILSPMRTVSPTKWKTVNSIENGQARRTA